MPTNITVADIRRIEFRCFELDALFAFAIYFHDNQEKIKTIVVATSKDKTHFEFDEYDGEKGLEVVEDIIAGLNERKEKAEEGEGEDSSYKNFKSASNDIYTAITILRDHYIREGIELLGKIKSSLDTSITVEEPLVADNKWLNFFQQLVEHELNETDVKNLLHFITRNKVIREMIKVEYKKNALFYSEGEPLKRQKNEE
ncbi:MAG: hypothetical protein V3R57_09850 [Candidatus Bathyarchaeia archaeon]